MSDPVSRAEFQILHAEVIRMRDRLHFLGTELTKAQIEVRLLKQQKRQQTQRTVGVSAAAGSVVAGAVYGILRFMFGQSP